MTGSLGRRYARAVLQLVRETGTLAETGDELGHVAATFAMPVLREVLLNPGIEIQARRTITDRVIARLGVSRTVGNLVRLLADRDRLAILPDVARAYEELVDRELGRARVRIRTATALTDAQVTELTELARRLTGSAAVVVTTAIDPELVGGVVLDVHGTVYDGSVKTQLARLAERMAGA